MELWIAEKRGVALKIAAELGVRHNTAMHIETTTGALIAWCEGHLLRLGEPQDYNPDWANWDAILPMIPDHWDTVQHELPRRRALLKNMGDLLKRATRVVIATDAGREGETIAREILAHFKYRGPVARFWGKAESPAGIRKALGELKDGRDTVRLYHAGKGRAIADWLVGLNATRMATRQASNALGGKGPLLSVGRVQSPTLALIVRRDREIEGFQSIAFWEVFVLVAVDGGSIRMKLISDRITNQLSAEQLAALFLGAKLRLSVRTERKHSTPPSLFNLALLQQAANKQFRWSLKRTQETAQSLKDKGWITYHRTDSCHLEDGQAADVPALLAVISRVRALAAAAARIGPPVIRKSVFDSSKVSDHPAITPTLDPPSPGELSDDESSLYQLICARTLAAVSPDYVYDLTTIEADHRDQVLRTTGKTPVHLGWRDALGEEPEEPKASELESGGFEQQTLPPVNDGAVGHADQVQVEERTTTPPKRYTEGTLQKDMTGIAKYATVPEIRKRLRETSGIGRPSTHDKIIETLIDRDYVSRQGIQLVSMPLGRALVDALLPELVEPTLTALWEDSLLDIEQGKSSPAAFLEDLKRYVPDLMTRMQANPVKLTEDLCSVRTGAHRKADSKQKQTPRADTAKASRFPNAGPRPTGFTAGAPRRPTDRARAYASELARDHGVKVPDVVFNDASECSAFIDRLKAGTPPAKSMERAIKLARARGVTLPAGTLERADACAKFIAENAR